MENKGVIEHNEKLDEVYVDAEYIANLLDGLEPVELNYIKKVCDMLIAKSSLQINTNININN